MIERNLAARLAAATTRFPCVAVTGPRQSGKSTLCRAVFGQHAYANLEAPDIRRFAAEDPRGFLGQYPRGAILDQIQRCPELTSYLQVLIDQEPEPGRWILTGSQNLMSSQSVSQSLAGRVAVLHLLPLSYDEVQRFEHHPATLAETLLTGGYPRILDQSLTPSEWLASYVMTYLERDVRTLANIGDLVTFQRFVELCAGRTGQLLNLSTLATDCGISQPTAKSWLSVLEASFLLFRLPSYSGNLRKRLVKTPKLHFYDTSLVCWLLGIREVAHLQSHPLRGAIFETWVVSEIAKHRLHRGEGRGLYYFRDTHGIEADLLVDGTERLAVIEAKAGATITPEMLAGVRRVRAQLEDAKPTAGFVVFGGDQGQRRSDVHALCWRDLPTLDWVAGD